MWNKLMINWDLNFFEFYFYQVLRHLCLETPLRRLSSQYRPRYNLMEYGKQMLI